MRVEGRPTINEVPCPRTMEIPENHQQHPTFQKLAQVPNADKDYPLLTGRVSAPSLNNSQGIIAAIVEEDAKVRKFYRATVETSCLTLPLLAQEMSVEAIHIKDESTRFGLDAFKSVGAYYAMSKLVDENPDIETFCTATDCNHGRAVAWGAQKFNKEAVVLVPKNTPTHYIKAIESHGAQVIDTQATYDETVEQATAMVKKNGTSWALVQDTAWKGYNKIPLWIMQGYLRMCHEMEEKLFPKEGAKVDAVILQVGVGSFAGAVTAYLVNRYGQNAPKIFCVEPEQADCLGKSILKGKLSSMIGSENTIMAGLNCGTPSALGYPILRDHAHDVLRVSDAEVAECMQTLLTPTGDDPKVVSGGSGAAVGLAALKQLLENGDFTPSRILLWNTEGLLPREKS